MSKFLLLFVFVIFLVGCNKDSGHGPGKIKWDRDSCQRCQMMLSDRNFSAQVRVFPQDKRSKVYKFDDLGCAVLWLETQQWQNDPATEIWVNDFNTSEWIAAKTAWYIKDNISPMGYGLGAQAEPAEGALNFMQAKKHIAEVEKKLNIHGGNLEH